jgi:hypothetical protein
MIELKGNNAYFIPPKNRYGLSTNETHDLTEHDFSILVNVKIAWDDMTAESPTKEGGIVAKNGKHCGLSAFKFNDDRIYIKAQWWVGSDTTEDEYQDIWFEVENNSEFMNIAMLHDSKTKTVTLMVDGKTTSATYTGKFIDYSDSWIWIGAHNSLDSCAVEHRGFLFGTIQHVSVYDSTISTEGVKTIYTMNSNDVLKSTPTLQTAASFIFNEENMTPYKVLDVSGNGNHMILFDKKWMANELI